MGSHFVVARTARFESAVAAAVAVYIAAAAFVAAVAGTVGL